MQIGIVTKGRSLVHVLRANPGTIQMLPRSTGMSGDTTGTDGKGLAHLRDLTKASTMVAAIRDIADTGADVVVNCFIVLLVCILCNV